MKRLLLLTLAVLTVQPAFAEPAAEEEELTEKVFLQLMYPDFLAIESFGLIEVVFEGEDAEKIRLGSDRLTEFVRLKFKNNFAKIPYKDQTDYIVENIEDDELLAKIGTLYVTVWVVGTDYPIAYHIEISAGSFAKESQYTSAALGYGSKDTAPDAIKKYIAELIEDLAITFFKTRGEL